MAVNPSISGQLYKVKTVATLRVSGAVEKCVFVAHATSREDAQVRVARCFESSRYVNFRVLGLEKVRHLHRISSRIFPSEALADVPVELEIAEPEEFSVSGPSQRTNLTSASKWVIGITGKMYASSAEHVLRKIGDYLLKLGNGVDTENPMKESAVVRIEQEGEVDSTVTTACQLRRMDATHFHEQKPLAGGAVGSGRR